MSPREFENFLSDFFRQNRDAIDKCIDSSTISELARAGDLLSTVLSNGGLVLTCGNGGSMTDAMHLAEELSGKYRHPRRALKSVALSDPSYLTCVANDFGYEQVFARGCEALLSPHDAVVLFTTSGTSTNMIEAAKVARQLGASVITFTGKSDTPLHELSDIVVDPGVDQTTEIAQVLHTIWLHSLIEIVEKNLG